MNRLRVSSADFETGHNPSKVAVIGAGMAGLSAARVLSEAGAEVTVFDKSRGTGGRLSSRSFEQGWIDHGAPYLSLSGRAQELVSFLRERTSSEALHDWQPLTAGVFEPDEQVSHIGVPRNSALTRSLLGDLEFRSSTRIIRFERSNDGWSLFSEAGLVPGHWNKVVVAVPVPQARALLTGYPELLKPLRSVSMEPCWVAALEAAEDLSGLADVTNYRHPVIRRISRNRAKPGRARRNIYLVQANKHWSREYLEVGSQAVGLHLQNSFKYLVSIDVKTRLLFAHLWRYALTEKPLGQPFLWDETLKLGVCGDWCLGRQVEDAWRSGFELARRMTTEKALTEDAPVQMPRSGRRVSSLWTECSWFGKRSSQ